MDQIAVDSNILGGIPVFVGTRVPVKTLFDYLEAGDSLDVFLSSFPDVSRNQALEVLEASKSWRCGAPGTGGDLAVAVLGGGDVQEECDQRALQAGAVTAQDGEARAAELGGAREVEDPQRLADLVVSPRLEIELRLLSPTCAPPRCPRRPCRGEPTRAEDWERRGAAVRPGPQRRRAPSLPTGCAA